MNQVTNRKMGAWLGLFVGDALGTTNEFKQRGTFEPIDDIVGGGPFKLDAGEWTDDGSMALCLAQTLLDDHEFNPALMMEHFAAWSTNSPFYSSNTRGCFDIGGQTQSAILEYLRTGNVNGPENPNASGNGGIMRLAPIALRYNDKEDVTKYSMMQSRPTHASDDCLMTAGYLGRCLHSFIHDTNAVTVENIKEVMVLSSYDEVGSTGYCVDSLDFALYCFANTRSFKDCVLMAANGGGDADTNSAIAGQIAGAYYGLSNIPFEWINKLAKIDVLMNIGEELIELSHR